LANTIFLNAELQGETQSWISRPPEEQLLSIPGIAEALRRQQHIGAQDTPSPTVDSLTDLAVHVGFLIPYSQEPRQLLLRLTETFRDVKLFLSPSRGPQTVLRLLRSDPRYLDLWNIEDDAHTSPTSFANTAQTRPSVDRGLPSHNESEGSMDFSRWIHTTPDDGVSPSGLDSSSPQHEVTQL
jgi:hypothetical protein